MNKVILAGILALISTPLSAQQPVNNFGVVANIGGAAGLGYDLPYVTVGGEWDHSFKVPLELQSEATGSPTHKTYYKSGTSLKVKARGIYWAKKNFGLTAGDEEGYLWTNAFNKHANTPSVGIGTRQWSFGLPGRIYLSYLVPSGVRPTDGSLQSNRTQGGEFVWENQISPRVRLGMTFQVLTFLNQSGAGQSPRNWTGTFMVNLRVGSKQDIDLLY